MAGKGPPSNMPDDSLGFDRICDQHQPIRLLKTFLRKGTIPHALLFTGIEGVGKRTTAMVFAMACLCKSNRPDEKEPFFNSPTNSAPIHRNGPCAQCRSCRRVASGTHPDLIRIDPDGAFIRIGQIRSLCATLTMKPYENGFRIVLIANAQYMNAEASNALLKVLEEPPDKTILILTASAASELLPTIISRCQRVKFNPLTANSIVKKLIQVEGLCADSAKVIAALASGSLSKALELTQHNFLSYRHWLLDAVGMQSFAGKKIPVWQGLALAEMIFKNKEYLNESLEIIKSCLRDILIYPYSPDKIINWDMAENIQKRSETESIDLVLKKMNAVNEAQMTIAANGNLRLTLEIMAMELIQAGN